MSAIAPEPGLLTHSGRALDDVAVIVCTRRRPATLRSALDSLAAQSGPPFEVLVVDNDDSPTALPTWRAFAAGFEFRSRYIHLAQLGLSRARNAGLKAAEAAAVAFLDDDAVARPGWLAAIREAVDRPDRPVAGGGPIHPLWPGARPAWVGRDLESYFTSLDLGASRALAVPAESPYGANFWVRRQDALAAGGFDSRYGRVGANLRSGEEVDLIFRLARTGPIWYSSGAAVDHRIDPARVSRGWLVRRVYRQGQADARIGPEQAGVRMGGDARSKPPLWLRVARVAGKVVGSVQRRLRPIAAPERSSSLDR